MLLNISILFLDYFCNKSKPVHVCSLYVINYTSVYAFVKETPHHLFISCACSVSRPTSLTGTWSTTSMRSILETSASFRSEYAAVLLLTGPSDGTLSTVYQCCIHAANDSVTDSVSNTTVKLIKIVCKCCW